MWRSNFTIPHRFAAYICRLYLPPTFVAYVLPPTFAAYIFRLCLPPTFAAYILGIRLHFEQGPIFLACVNILGKCQYFDDFCNKFLLDFVAANICVYFQYLFMHFLCAPIFLAQLF
jgi:hypothetical protein